MKEILELDLYKELTEHYEVYYKLQPLTAKIYALLVFNNCQAGLTFDQLLDVFQSSKSSISHSLHTLTDMHFIEQIKKDNQRKRFFRANQQLFLMRLKEVQERLKREREIHSKLYAYRKSTNDDLFDKKKVELYLEHLADVTESIQSTITNLKSHIQTNESLQ